MAPAGCHACAQTRVLSHRIPRSRHRRGARARQLRKIPSQRKSIGLLDLHKPASKFDARIAAISATCGRCSSHTQCFTTFAEMTAVCVSAFKMPLPIFSTSGYSSPYLQGIINKAPAHKYRSNLRRVRSFFQRARTVAACRRWPRRRARRTLWLRTAAGTCAWPQSRSRRRTAA